MFWWTFNQSINFNRWWKKSVSQPETSENEWLKDHRAAKFYCKSITKEMLSTSTGSARILFELKQFQMKVTFTLFQFKRNFTLSHYFSHETPFFCSKWKLMFLHLWTKLIGNIHITDTQKTDSNRLKRWIKSEFKILASFLFNFSSFFPAGYCNGRHCSVRTR